VALTTTKVGLWNRALGRIGVTDLLEDEDDDRPEAEVCRLVHDDLVRQALEAYVWPWAMRQTTLSSIDEQTTTYDDSTTPAVDGTNDEFTIPYAYVDSQQLTVELLDADGNATELENGTDYTVTEAADGVQAFATLTDPPAVGESVRVTVTTERTGWEHVFALPDDCVTPVALLYEDTRHVLVPAECRIEHAIMANDAGDGWILCANFDSDEVDGFEYVAFIESPTAWTRHFVDAVVWRIAAELANAIKKDAEVANYCLRMYEAALDAAAAQAQNMEQSVQALTPSLVARDG
jgi:hypothetical protein